MYKTFEDAEKDYYGLWYSETPDRAKAIDIAKSAYNNFPEHKNHIIMDLIVFYSETGDIDKCKEMLNVGFENGYWYPEIYIPNVFSNEVYADEVIKWNELRDEAMKDTKVIYDIDYPTDFNEDLSYPLFISLHGWGENLELFKRFWKSDLMKKDFMHVYIQSSQKIGSSHFAWTNRDVSKTDIYTVIEEVKSNFLIDDFIIVGGFSEGATMAMDLAFSDQELFNGFVSLNPNRPKSLSNENMIKTNLRGGIITGDLDKSYNEQLELVDVFNEANFPCEFKINKDFGHWFPENLGVLVDEIIEYISYGNMNYSQLLNVTMELYGEEQYKFAYDFITKYSKDIVCNDVQIYNFRYSIACKMGDAKLGMSILKEAVIDKGYWYSYEYLVSDTDLNSLHDLDEFKTVLELCKEREEASVFNKPKLFVEDKRITSNSKLFMVLHGDQENYDVVKDNWNVDDVILAFAESSQEEFSTGYVWSDIDKGISEIKSHLTELNNKYDIEDITIAAFSAGASVLLEGITSNSIEVDNIILLAPWLPNLEDIKADLVKLKEMDIKVVIACGDEDDDCFESTKKLSNYLDDVKISHEFIMLEGLDHAYPNDMESLLEYFSEYFEKE